MVAHFESFSLRFCSGGGGPIHARVPIHAHPWIYPKQSQLNNILQMYMINLRIIYDVVNIFSIKNYKSSRKLGVGLNWYPGMNWSTTTIHSWNNFRSG